MLPASCVWIGFEEYSPIELSYESGQLTASHVLTHYSVDKRDIEDVTLIDTLPSRSRIKGTGMENLQKGHYNVLGYGSSTLCLNHNLSIFILIRNKDEKIYILSAKSDEETIAIYKELITDLDSN